MKKKKILYLGNFSFPFGNAAGNRVYGIGKILKELGNSVSYIGVSQLIDSNTELENSKNIYEDYDYFNLAYPKGSIGWFKYKNDKKLVINFIERNNFDLIICYGSPRIALFVYAIHNWCKKNDKKFIIDCVDLLAITNGSLIYRIVKGADEWILKKVLTKKADGIISISEYLANIFNKTNTVVIPPVIDTNRFKSLPLLPTSSVINLVYVGVPFPIDERKVDKERFKDRLDLAIEALLGLNDIDFQFKIYGLTLEQYLRVVPEHSLKINESSKIKFYGKISNETALYNISQADFTILLRDKNKMTSAGFPTKFVESISCGTPVITTNTSDLEKYLTPGKNGFFVKINHIEGLKKQIKSIISMEKSEIAFMKRYCKDHNPFDYKLFEDKLETFLSSVFEDK